ncbi:MAG: hypothetical protein E7301_07400 [Butyrivibrio sp.]|nr:hypothetical protein [Butyrivibrio sp.]
MGTFNIFSTLIYICIIFFSLYLFYRRDRSSYSPINLSDVVFNRIYTLILPIAMIVIGAFLRFYMIARIPYGVHQDEASIGYEAYILSAFGMDRNGYHLPVYPITYGSGGGSPLMVYLTALMTKLLGVSEFSLRFLPAFLGSLTLVVFFLAVRLLVAESLLSSEKVSSVQYMNGEYSWIPLISLTILTLSPWHIMLSRWSLDSNTTPFWISLGLLFFAIGIKKQRESSSFNSIGSLFAERDRKKSRLLSMSNGTANLFFVLSALAYALTMYSYGSATIIIPVHLLILCIFSIRKKKMTAFQMVLGILVFLAVSSPLIVFYVINAFDLPEIITPFFSINRFTAKRSVFVSDGILLSIAGNIIAMIKNLTIGNSAEQILNYVEGFPPLFAFTFPAALVGIVASFVRAKKGKDVDVFMLSVFIPAFLFGCFVEEDINRMVFIFIPYIYFLARGYIFFINEIVYAQKNTGKKAIKYLMILIKGLAPFLFFVAAMLFIKVYFTTYNALSSDAFMAGYGECCKTAENEVADDKMIYSTYEHLSAPFMVALYYTKTPPTEFLQTVHYKDEKAEFRIADSFGNFIFSLPDDLSEKIDSYISEGNVLILHNSELESYDLDNYEVKTSGNYAVVSAK